MWNEQGVPQEKLQGCNGQGGVTGGLQGCNGALQGCSRQGRALQACNGLWARTCVCNGCVRGEVCVKSVRQASVQQVCNWGVFWAGNGCVMGRGA